MGGEESISPVSSLLLDRNNVVVRAIANAAEPTEGERADGGGSAEGEEGAAARGGEATKRKGLVPAGDRQTVGGEGGEQVLAEEESEAAGDNNDRREGGVPRAL